MYRIDAKWPELAKMDIKQAFRLVPVHLADRRLLDIQWQVAVYVDKCLPFGLCSTPILFSMDTIEGMLQLQGVWFIEHYIDNFITMGTITMRNALSPALSLSIVHACTVINICRKTHTPLTEHYTLYYRLVSFPGWNIRSGVHCFAHVRCSQESVHVWIFSVHLSIVHVRTLGMVSQPVSLLLLFTMVHRIGLREDLEQKSEKLDAVSLLVNEEKCVSIHLLSMFLLCSLQLMRLPRSQLD